MVYSNGRDADQELVVMLTKSFNPFNLAKCAPRIAIQRSFPYMLLICNRVVGYVSATTRIRDSAFSDFLPCENIQRPYPVDPAMIVSGGVVNQKLPNRRS